VKATNKRHGKRVPMDDRLRGIVLSLMIPKFGCVCWYCGVELGVREIHIDHIDPLSRGGADTIHNLALACKNCNRAKWDSTLVEFTRWVNRLKSIEKFPAKDGFKADVIPLDDRRTIS